MGRSPCCVKEGMNRGAWTAMEDKILIEYIKAHGEGRWRNLPKRAGLKRCGKSCRLRWLNYLRPDIKRGNITPDEEELILRLHKLLGNRWSLIAGRLPGRTDNEIKNYWNTNLSKRLNATNDQVTNHNPKKSQNDSTKKRKKSSIMDTPKPSNVQAIQSNVVRTKAIRCTKSFINPQPQSMPQPQPQPQPVHANNITLNDNHNYSWTRLEEEYNKMSLDFMMENNVNMGDFKLISELLTTDLMDICDFGNESMSGGSDFSSNSEDDPFIFSQELLEDWLGDNNQLI